GRWRQGYQVPAKPYVKQFTHSVSATGAITPVALCGLADGVSRPDEITWRLVRFASTADKRMLASICPLVPGADMSRSLEHLSRITKPESVEIVSHRAYTSNSQEADHEDHSHQRRAVRDNYQPSITGARSRRLASFGL